MQSEDPIKIITPIFKNKAQYSSPFLPIILSKENTNPNANPNFTPTILTNSNFQTLKFYYSPQEQATPINFKKGMLEKIKEKNENTKTKIAKCTCSKTKCLKKYCECYAKGQFCIDCDCKDCCNQPTCEEEKPVESSFTMSCTCSKSGCNKKYCECFKSGGQCNDKCRCVNCLNKVPKNVSLFQVSDTSSYKEGKVVSSLSTSTCNSQANTEKKGEKRVWSIQRTSVYICDNNIDISITKIPNEIFEWADKDREKEVKYLGRKKMSQNSAWVKLIEMPSPCVLPGRGLKYLSLNEGL